MGQVVYIQRHLLLFGHRSKLCLGINRSVHALLVKVKRNPIIVEIIVSTVHVDSLCLIQIERIVSHIEGIGNVQVNFVEMRGRSLGRSAVDIDIFGVCFSFLFNIGEIEALSDLRSPGIVAESVSLKHCKRTTICCAMIHQKRFALLIYDHTICHRQFRCFCNHSLCSLHITGIYDIEIILVRQVVYSSLELYFRIRCSAIRSFSSSVFPLMGSIIFSLVSVENPFSVSSFNNIDLFSLFGSYPSRIDDFLLYVFQCILVFCGNFIDRID